ncbi:MAG: arginyltransferase [Pseudomonadota bacterium]
MTEHFGKASSEFFVTAPSACPYLPGRLERKVFTVLQGPTSERANEVLTHRGFRRSQNIIYRPACDRCAACVPVRAPARAFQPSRSQRRIMSRNADLQRALRPPVATDEQFSLLRDYLDDRHSEGGMADMTLLDYMAMVEETSVDTVMVEYRDFNGALAACALTDRLADGLSMVYSFFSPRAARRSLGAYMILDHIALCNEERRDFVYLGYWVENSPKMAYKTRFRPLERLTRRGWEPLNAPTQINGVK